MREAADGNGEAVNERKLAVELEHTQELLPQPRLELPKVSRLPRKRRVVDGSQGREVVCVVAAKVSEQRLLLVEAQELTDYFQCKHLGDLEGRLLASPAQPLATECRREGVINEVEDCYNEGIIQFSVKRHALCLGLPRDRGYKRARPASQEVYKRYSNFREALPDGIQTRRAEWLSATKANPTAGRHELISLVNYTYYFLRRHDRKWLEANQPPSRKPLPPPQRVDWKGEDTKLAAAIKLAAVKIMKVAGRPVHVSKASIIREVGHQSWIEQHLHDLPRTARVQTKHLEGYEDFFVRRIEWAENSYLLEGIFPTRQQLTVRAGTRTKTGKSPRVQSSIDAAIARLKA